MVRVVPEATEPIAAGEAVRAAECSDLKLEPISRILRVYNDCGC